MCQMRIIVQSEDKEETVMEDAAHIDVEDNAIRASSLLNGPAVFPGMRIRSIDCLDNRVTLIPHRGGASV